MHTVSPIPSLAAGTVSPDPQPEPQPARVLVTGASSGIGRAVAHALAAQGSRLWLLSRSPESLDVAARECREAGAPEVHTLAGDVADPDVVEDAVARARPDAVVHSAAVVSYGYLADTPTDVLARVVDTNVLGSLLVSRAALRSFRSAGGTGRLVLVGSVLGQVPVPLMGPYVVSKAAVGALGEVLRIETRGLPGVGVTVLTPGAVDTPLYDQAATVTGQEGRPPPPVVSPERVAAAVVKALQAERPPGVVSVGPVNVLLRAGYTLAPPLYRALVEPAMRLLALGGPTLPTRGNVHAPAPHREGVAGRWRVPWGSARHPRMHPAGTGIDEA
jgi:short-subunit dehydrogenase